MSFIVDELLRSSQFIKNNTETSVVYLQRMALKEVGDNLTGYDKYLFDILGSFSHSYGLNLSRRYIYTLVKDRHVKRLSDLFDIAESEELRSTPPHKSFKQKLKRLNDYQRTVSVGKMCKLFKVEELVPRTYTDCAFHKDIFNPKRNSDFHLFYHNDSYFSKRKRIMRIVDRVVELRKQEYFIRFMNEVFNDLTVID